MIKHKINNILVYFILANIFVFNCAEKKNPKVFEVQVVSTFRLSEEAQEHLHRMYTKVVYNPDADEMAFTNYISPVKVVLTDSKGQLIDVIGEEGRGPDEIQSARYFGFDQNGDIVILDKVSAFFKRFNRINGEVTSYEYPIKEGISVTSRNLQQCDDDWYLGVQLLGEPTLPNVPIVAFFDSQFDLIDTLGGYDPFFQGRSDLMQETLIDIDCEKRQIFTAHGKTPFVQVFSMDHKKLLDRTEIVPPSFMLSGRFIQMVTSPREMTRYLSKEQSLSLHLALSDKYIFHIYRNERNSITEVRNLNDSDHYAAVYDKESRAYLREVKLPGAVLGSTEKGDLIILSDERTYEIQIVRLIPSSE